jgi:hypothetical protein
MVPSLPLQAMERGKVTKSTRMGCEADVHILDALQRSSFALSSSSTVVVAGVTGTSCVVAFSSSCGGAASIEKKGKMFSRVKKKL